jgi:hypothetical protein
VTILLTQFEFQHPILHVDTWSLVMINPRGDLDLTATN